jgi:hypothetical protein
MSLILAVIIKVKFQESLEGYVGLGYLYAFVGSGSWVGDMSQSVFINQGGNLHDGLITVA